MSARKVVGGLLGAGALLAAAAAAYPRLGRERCLHWGSTEAEASGPMAGDDLPLVAAPDIVSTRSITVDAPPSAIWPWLVQMGPGRGGAYTYDWVENLLGLDMHSADSVLPQFQDLAVGDVQALGAKGPRMRIEILDEDKAMVSRSEDGHWVWAFELRPAGGGTRLLSRNRIASPEPGAAGRLVNTLVMEPGSLVMERKMLLGIKARAEDLASTQSPDPPA